MRIVPPITKKELDDFIEKAQEVYRVPVVTPKRKG